jgi:hypothetical protein
LAVTVSRDYTTPANQQALAQVFTVGFGLAALVRDEGRMRERAFKLASQ